MEPSELSDTQAVPSELSDTQAVEQLQTAYTQVRQEMGNVIVGLDDVIEQVFITLICGGHCILEGVPGVAKTRLISTHFHPSFSR